MSHDFVQVIGMPGIGKSSLVRNAVHYLSDRNQFLLGVSFVEAKEVESIEILVKILIKDILLHADSEKFRQMRDMAISTPEELIDFLFAYIEQR